MRNLMIVAMLCFLVLFISYSISDDESEPLSYCDGKTRLTFKTQP